MPLKRYYLPIIITLASLMLFINIGSRDLMEWDESHNGSNAYEMLQREDFINYYYAGEVDTWNAKPPLFIWLVIICYKTFGYNEVALRLPSAIATLFFFIYLYKLVKIFEDDLKAFFTCLLLLGCKAVIGLHIGLSGDFDALLILFLTASAYYFLLYVEKDRISAIYLSAIMLSCAFYTKGPAALIYMPGYVLYLIARRKYHLLYNNNTLLAAVIFTVISSTWIVLALLMSKFPEHSVYGADNAISTMFVHDTYNRLFSSDFGEKMPTDYGFMISVVDARMNLWNYLYYAAFATGIMILAKNKQSIMTYIIENRLLIFCICQLMPVYILFTFATHKHAWYMAPFFGFIAIIIINGLWYWGNKRRYLYAIGIALFAFTFSRHLYYIKSQPTELHRILSNNNPHLRGIKKIWVTEVPPQHIFLYLQWMGIQLEETSPSNHLDSNQTLLLKKTELNAFNAHPVQYFGNYSLATAR